MELFTPELVFLSSVCTILEGFYFVLFQAVRPFELIRLYGPPGVILFYFGSRNTWRLQAQVLGELKKEDAFSFTRCVKDECTMISVAVSEVDFSHVRWLSNDTVGGSGGSN